jgi:hypothetical protein
MVSAIAERTIPYQERGRRETIFRFSADRDSPCSFPCELRCLRYCMIYISESISFKPESPLERVSSVRAFLEYLCRTSQVRVGCKDVDSSSRYISMATRRRANNVSLRSEWMWMDYLLLRLSYEIRHIPIQPFDCPLLQGLLQLDVANPPEHHFVIFELVRRDP